MKNFDPNPNLPKKSSKWDFLTLAAKTLIKPRSGHKRAYIWIFLATYAACSLNFFGIFSLLPLFVLKSPISWTAGTLGIFFAVRVAIESLGLLSGPFFIRYLKCSELTLILLNMFSMFGLLTLLSFVRTGWMVFLAAIVGIFADLYTSCVKTIMVEKVGGGKR